MRTVLLAWLFSLLAAGCGGSSSETPPPLEPDPTSFRYTGVRPPIAADGPAAAPAAEPSEEVPAEPRRPAAATWGSGKPASGAAQPSMTSPNALPESPPPAKLSSPGN